LAAGDPSALRDAADHTTSAAVAAGGAAVWRAVGLAFDQQPAPTSRILHEAAPYGVAYPVAEWVWGPPDHRA
jgi:hypothetical protein